MTVRIISEPDMDADTDRAIREGLCVCFPEDAGVFCHTRAWHGSAPEWSVVMEDDAGCVVAHAGVVSRTIEVGGKPLKVAGIQNVFVIPEFRGRGFCDQVMSAAMRQAASGDYDCGLLFCVPALENVYARCGWKSLGDRETVRIDENGSEVPVPGKNIAMFYPLKATGFPAGLIHLRGNDW